MKYSIGTMLILQKFDGKSHCPFCEIQKTVNDRLTDTFSEEAVMEDSVRAQVNKKGFCAKHYDDIYEKSKLGIALQIHTRLNEISALIGKSHNAKQAKKQAEKLTNALSTCVICEQLNDHMDRYVETVVKMFGAEKNFKDVFEKENFCLPHYAKMLEKANCASDPSDFLNSLNDKMIKDTDFLSKEIRAFCDNFDYRNIGKTPGDEKYALINTRRKLYGKK